MSKLASMEEVQELLSEQIRLLSGSTEQKDLTKAAVVSKVTSTYLNSIRLQMAYFKLAGINPEIKMMEKR